MGKILYLIVASAFLGAGLFSIDIRIMQLSLYRLSLFAMVFYLLINNLLLDKKVNIRIKDRQSFIIRFYLFWVIYAIYSLAWVLDLTSGLKILFFIGTGFLCIWLFSTFVRKEKDFKGIFNTIFLMIILHNALAWFELQTGRYFFADLKKIDRYNNFSFDKSARVPITVFSNTNDFATLMTFGVFISFIVLLNTKKIWVRILSSFTIISSVILVFRSGSRANMLGIILGVVAISMLIILKKVNKYVIISLGIAGIAFVLLYPPLNERIMAIIRNRVLSRFGSQSLSVKSDEVRGNLIKNGFIFLFNTLGFGTGVGNIEYWMQERQVFYVGKVFNIHNWWVEILVGYGIFVFMGYIFVYILKTQTLLIAYVKSTSVFIRNTSLGLFGFMIAFIVSSVSSSSNINTEWLWLFWAVLIAFIGYILRDFKMTQKVEIN